MKLSFKFIFPIVFTIAGMFAYSQFNSTKHIENKNIVNTIPISQSSEISISFVGDILLAANVEKKINREGVNYPFSEVKSILSTADFAMGNLENPVGTGGTPIPKKQYTFRASPRVLEGVKWSGIDVMSIANNHILDYGVKPFNETLQNLSDNGLHYVGAGRNEEEAFKPVILEKNNKKIAFLAGSHVIPYTSWYAGKNSPGVAGIYNPAKIIERIKAARQEADIVVVYLHWGIERETMPKAYQKNIGKKLIDNGADVVIGSHPHVLQGFEVYKGKLIAYSLGNFVFTDQRKETLVLQVSFDEKGLMKAEIIPCLIKNYRPEIIEDENQKKNFYKMIEDRSFNIKINEGKIIIE